MFNVDAKLFEIASRFVSGETTRPYIRGVLIEPCEAGGVALVATDGHRMFVAYDETGGADAPAAIRCEKPFLSQMRKASRLFCDERGARGQCQQTGNTQWRAEIFDDSENLCGGAVIQRVERDFPDWRRVLPSSHDGGPSALDSRFLSDFAKAGQDMAKARGSRIGSMKVTGGEDWSVPNTVCFGGEIPAFGVIMPLRESVVGAGVGIALMDRINAAPQMVAAE